MKYICDICDYETGDKSNYNKHMISPRHNKKKEGKSTRKIYMCKVCNHFTENSSNYNKHMTTHDMTLKKINQMKIEKMGIIGEIRSLTSKLEDPKCDSFDILGEIDLRKIRIADINSKINTYNTDKTTNL